MDAQWYLNKEGHKTGPFNTEDLGKEGIFPDTLIWSDKRSQWVLASEIPELKDYVKVTPPQNPYFRGFSSENQTPPPTPKDVQCKKYFQPKRSYFIKWCVGIVLIGLIFLRFFTPLFASIFESYIWARMSLVVSGLILLIGTWLSFYFKEKFYKKWIFSTIITLAGGNILLMYFLFHNYGSYDSSGFAEKYGTLKDVYLDVPYCDGYTKYYYEEGINKFGFKEINENTYQTYTEPTPEESPFN